MPTMLNPLLEPGQVLDGYKIIRQIGEGGFGTVWLCQAQLTGNYHALKLVLNTSLEIFEKERNALIHYRQASSRLRSPHLMPIEHVNSMPFGLFYLMPLADGYGANDPPDESWHPSTLASLVEQRRTESTWFTQAEVLGIMRPVLEGLQILLDAGLVHRDVKPDNILFYGGQPCLGDISLVGEDAHIITQRGTPGYSTPSWYLDAGGHPDMYGAAATLYTLLTGNLPDKMGKARFRWPPQAEASFSPEDRQEWQRLQRIVIRATEEHPANRFLTYRAFAEALDGTPAKLDNKFRIRLGLAVAAALVLLAVFGVFFSQKPPSNLGAVSQSLLTSAETGSSHPQAVNPWAELDALLEKIKAIAKDEAKSQDELNKKAQEILASLSQGTLTFEKLQGVIAPLGEVIKKAKAGVKRRYDLDAEMQGKLGALNKSATEADQSLDGWKTARAYDARAHAVLFELSGANANDSETIYNWQVTVQKASDRYLNFWDKETDQASKRLGKSKDPDDMEKRPAMTKGYFVERDKVAALAREIMAL